jgi:hypothetical protein
MLSVDSNQHGFFPTLHDALAMARSLLANLTELSNLTYPFAVRNGVINMAQERDSKQAVKEGLSLKAGATTFFFDLRETKQGAPFLSITESRGKGEGKGFERKTINVFADQAEEFAKIVYRASGEVVRRNKAAGRGVSK